ncbi:MAG: site-specific integrase [Planctomycetota bacterium]|nr:MAG: site-specific integrase [Planctomycetota bacterium]
MPRKPNNKPWLHAPSGFWCATLNGKRVYLDKDARTADQVLRQLKAEQKRNGGIGRDWKEATLSELADEFLSDLKSRRKPGTYEQSRYALLRALRILGTHLKVGEVRRLHLAKIEQSMVGKNYSPSTIRDTLAKVQQVFSWAVELELLELNPLVGYRKPARRMRTRIITSDEFQAMLRATPRNPAFRRVLVALRMTGCRPGELRSLTWDMVDLDQGVWIIPDHKTVTTQKIPRPRVVPLPSPILNLCIRLARRPHENSDPVFLNMLGKRYSKDGLVRLMARVRTRAGIGSKAGESIVLYSHRHTYGTEAAGRVSDIELAELMGHTDTHTTRRYVHLNSDRLRDIQRRIQAGR